MYMIPFSSSIPSFHKSEMMCGGDEWCGENGSDMILHDEMRGI